MNKLLLNFIIVLLLLPSISCYEELTDAPLGNKPPDTFISIFPDSSISQQQSSIRLNWWGDDPDGLIIGYFITFNDLEWVFTSSNDSLISFPITGMDTTYNFRVASVDNSGNGVYDNNLSVNTINFGSEPFTDLNDDGQWNQGEPFIDCGAIDPEPASLELPLRNSPPELSFLVDKSGNTILIPETTFTVASFGWTVSDIDGDATVQKLYIALNDSSLGIELPGNTRFVTLKAEPPFTSEVVDCDVYLGSSITSPYHTKLPGLRLNAENIFYIYAEDIAGAKSEIKRMPSSGTESKWFVRKPTGNILIIDDNGSIDNSTSFYNAMFDSLNLSGRFDIWDIKLGRTTSTPGVLLPKFISPQFTETLKLYKYLIWYTDNDPSLEPAQISINPFIENGGKVLFSMIFPQLFDPRGLSDFLPIDSLSYVPIPFLQKNTLIEPTVNGTQLNYPLLAIDEGNTSVARIRTYFPNSSASVTLYTLDRPGDPVIGFKSSDSRKVYMGVPLHRSNGSPFNVKEFFENVLFNEFGVLR